MRVDILCNTEDPYDYPTSPQAPHLFVCILEKWLCSSELGMGSAYLLTSPAPYMVELTMLLGPLRSFLASVP